MNWIDLPHLTDGLRQQLQRELPPDGLLRWGHLIQVEGTLLTARLPAFMGELCYILPSGALAEVVAINEHHVSLSPFGQTDGFHCGQQVVPLGRQHQIPVGEGLLGRVVDGLGRPYDGTPIPHAVSRIVNAPPPCALKRHLIDRPLITGIRAIDTLLTCGEGQRIGIFAAAGVGKSSLLSMLCDIDTPYDHHNASHHSKGSDADVADVNVLALIGERGREVREFLEQALTPQARQRSVIVVATADRPALERMRALAVATTIAEAFRDQGKKVLLLVDSLTRFARAAREIALAAGETAVSGSYPPSVLAALPRLLERSGKGEQGSITAFYTVLVEADNMNEPLADEVRSLLDGHIVLSRRLAESAHFPAIDILASVSRVMPLVTSDEHRALANEVRHLLSAYRQVELLVRVGEYQPGEDPDTDRALEMYPLINRFLQQKRSEPCTLTALLDQLQRVMRK